MPDFPAIQAGGESTEVRTIKPTSVGIAGVVSVSCCLSWHQVASRAAFILAAANAGLGLIPLTLKRRIKPGPEEAMIQEIREMSLEDISSDLDALGQQVASYGSDLKLLVSGGSALGSGGLQDPQNPTKEQDDDGSQATTEV